MKEKIISLFLPILQMITGCFATGAFFVLVNNDSFDKRAIFTLVIAILGFTLGTKGLILFKKKLK